MQEMLKAKVEELLKPGKGTSEFYLTLAAQVIGSALAVGLIPTDSPWEKLAGMALMVLSSLGYKWSRSALKVEGLRTLTSLAAMVPYLAEAADEKEEVPPVPPVPGA